MTIKVAKLASLGLLIVAACVGLAGCRVSEDPAAPESVTTRTSAIVTSGPACADGTIEDTFTSGIVGCAGTVTWDERRSLCGGGYRPVTAAEWAVNALGGPTHHYWTDDNLHVDGGGSGSCWVSLTSGFDCGAGTPMRVCMSALTDPEGNRCNWQDCGLESAVPNRFFGGCSGNTTAGTLCIPTACADGTVDETFTGGLAGCAGSVTWDNRRALCGGGYRPATATEWAALGGVAPQHNYWTDDPLQWSGAGPSACTVSLTTGSPCWPDAPMLVCTASGGPDPEGNGPCTWTDCGLDANTPSKFFGGCPQNRMAGTLCVPEGCADATAEQVFPGGMVGCAGTASGPSTAASLCAPGYRLVDNGEYAAIAHPEIRNSFTIWPNRAYWTQTTQKCPFDGCSVTTGGALCVPQRGCADGTAEQVMPEGFVGCGGAVPSGRIGTSSARGATARRHRENGGPSIRSPSRLHRATTTGRPTTSSGAEILAPAPPRQSAATHARQGGRCVCVRRPAATRRGTPAAGGTAGSTMSAPIFTSAAATRTSTRAPFAFRTSSTAITSRTSCIRTRGWWASSRLRAK